MENRFRILSIDGGGIRGVFPAAYLAYVEDVTGKRLVDYFDLMVGTSTGGIIALALSLGIPAAEVLRLYLDQGPRIFPAARGLAALVRSVRWLLAPKYSDSPLTAVLQQTFGSRQLGEAHCRVCIPAYDATVDDVHIYKTAHLEKLRSDYLVPVAEIARATSAAPTFLPPWRSRSGALLIDGGMWANNPAMVGLTEALGMLRVPLDQLYMLSLGTTRSPHTWIDHARRGGIAAWARQGAALVLTMRAQEIDAHNQASILLRDRYLRMNPDVAGGRFGLDTVRTAAELRAHGEKQARHTLKTVETLFLAAPKGAFVPFHPLEPQASAKMEIRKAENV